MSDYEETQQAPLRYFQASKLGNGVGLTVIQRDVTGSDACQTLTIHVLPKLWQTQNTADIAFVLPNHITDSHFHTFVYEMDVIGLEESWALYLAQVTQARDRGLYELEETEEGATDPLWTEVKKRPETQPLIPLNPGEADTLWKLVNAKGLEPAVLPDRVDLPPASDSILPDVPQLKIQFYHQFLSQAEEAVRQRKPVFLKTHDELNFVRGRMVPQGLVKRKVQHRMPVLCEYDSLSADSHIWQVIRSAVQITGQEADSHVQSRSVEVDAHLRDVGNKTPTAVLSERLSSTELARVTVSLRNTYLLARSILARQLGIGFEAPVYSGGVIANIKIVSSDLWERLVADYLEEATGLIPNEQLETHLYYDEAGQPTVRPKRPDLVLMGSQRPVVIDAKYKFKRQGIAQAYSSDQYQLTTYAYRLAADAFLAYPCRAEQASVDCKVSYLAQPGSPSNGKLDNGHLAYRIGVLSLPFPSPGASDFTLSEDYRSYIAKHLSGS